MPTTKYYGVRIRELVPRYATADVLAPIIAAGELTELLASLTPEQRVRAKGVVKDLGVMPDVRELLFPPAGRMRFIDRTLGDLGRRTTELVLETLAQFDEAVTCMDARCAKTWTPERAGAVAQAMGDKYIASSAKTKLSQFRTFLRSIGFEKGSPVYLAVKTCANSGCCSAATAPEIRDLNAIFKSVFDDRFKEDIARLQRLAQKWCSTS